MADTAQPPFGVVLRDLLIDHGITTGMGNPNWSAFAERLNGVGYETLRKAVTGERAPSPALMEACADVFNLDPVQCFWEYALWDAQKMFDPNVVGADVALDNLERWRKKQRAR